MYKYTHTCIYIHIYMSAHIHTYTYIHTHIYMNARKHAWNDSVAANVQGAVADQGSFALLFRSTQSNHISHLQCKDFIVPTSHILRSVCAHCCCISLSSSAHARTSLDARVHAHQADCTQKAENSNLCKHNKPGKHAQTERSHRHGQGMGHAGAK